MFQARVDDTDDMASIAIGQKAVKPAATVRWSAYLLRLGAAAFVAGLLIAWNATLAPVQVSVDGQVVEVWTHRTTVASLLRDLGVRLDPEDRVMPGRDARLRRGQPITVERAQAVQVWIDGRRHEGATWATTAREVLLEAGFDIDEYDSVYVNAQKTAIDEPIVAQVEVLQAEVAAVENSPFGGMIAAERPPIVLRIERAIPIVVDDGGLPFVIRTTAGTVGEALREAELTIYLGDRVDPSLGSEISPDLRVRIQRSRPAVVTVDGRTYRTRTLATTVADALTELKIGVSGMDRVEPSLETALLDDMQIRVVRVAEEVEVEEEIAPFETVFVPDGNLPIDTQSVVNVGAEGITRTRFRVRYEDGEEVSSVQEDRWIAQEPAERVIAYGQLIEPKTFVAEDGTQITYWRHIRMLASSYSAGTAGVPTTASYYGRTYTGDPMAHGVVAVDPRIIPLRSSVYVPGYGNGRALDTGSAIIARRIDLGFDDSNLEYWNRWVDVYLLWPPPAANQITWVLPNWPVQPR